MAKQRFNDRWYFLKQPLNAEYNEVMVKREQFSPVSIPHDWMITQADALYEDGSGWYTKRFFCTDQEHKDIYLCFEGVYMDSTVYLNGKKLGDWKYGYSMFYFDLTDKLLREQENELVVQVRYQTPNSRWYTGAGIYRDVWLYELPKKHFELNGVYITEIPVDASTIGKTVASSGDWQVDIDVEVNFTETEDEKGYPYLIQGSIKNQAGDVVALAEGKIGETLSLFVSRPKLWDLEEPSLYACKVKLMVQNIDGKQTLDTVEEKIGFRTVYFDTYKGLFLNGRHIKLNGVCEHHDLGALGAAFHTSALERKLNILQKMGVNSIRCSHNMPAREMLELADQMGFLIIDEAFDMWERSKNPYDYARFFKEWYKKDVESWIKRDRNHPCVLFWSIGNEIYDTHASERGIEVTKLLMEEVEKHDPRGHAPVTIGSNFMPWENARKCADVVKFAGYNYGEKYYEEHHRAHPDWYIYGSETSSTVQSRGIYHFPYKQSVLADEDEQCSALGNSTTSWGAKSSEACIIAERDHEFSLGQFLWSGFDYIGEPTPYHTRNSYFGQIDTAGFPKDSYYIYQAEWTDYKKAPMVHVFPYWDFNDGQTIDVRVCSNAPSVELFLNGTSQGEYQIDHAHGKELCGLWSIPYTKGEIKAVAYNEQHVEIASESRHSFDDPAQIILSTNVSKLTANSKELAFVEISAQDEQGFPVENATNQMKVTVEGNGILLGLDNGDSTDTDPYKGSSKRLFSGKMLAIVGVNQGEDQARKDGLTKQARRSETGMQGQIKITVSSKGLKPAILTIPVVRKWGVGKEDYWEETFQEKPFQEEPFWGELHQEELCFTGNVMEDSIWVRKIELTSDQGTSFTSECNSITVRARSYPTSAMTQSYIWKVVDDAGIESHLATVEAKGDHAVLTAKGDGSFRLRCMVKNGTDIVKVISTLEFTAKGLGQAYLDPYGFITGGTYHYFEGEPGNGNEHGVSTARDGRTVVGFEGIDFGKYGSNQITLWVFELESRECPIEIWEGIPEKQGSELLAKVIYHKQSIWNVYQEESYTLDRKVKGIAGIYFVLNQKIHLKGFSFTALKRGLEKLTAAENDHIYGDQFTVEGDAVLNIGNNVTMEYEDMDFGPEGATTLRICGRTPNDKNTIHILFSDGTTKTRQIVEFPHSEDWIYKSFPLDKVTGTNKVQFVFLPGSHFDFKYFLFC